MNADSTIKYSIVVPFYNEEHSVAPLYVKLTQVMTGLDEPYELIFVDDGSRDGTLEALNTIYDNDSRVRVVSLRRNFGQTAALKAGFDIAAGEIIISMDGDLQHDPEEIPAFLAKMEEGYELVSGWREQRLDHWLTRRLPSRIANAIMARISGTPLHDFGTTFKAYRREVIQSIQLYGDLHRFIPALATWSGARIAEIPIKNIPRTNGKSNYGLSRIFRVFLDLLSIKFLLAYSTRPLHFFGFFGLAAGGAGSLISAYLVLKKILFHEQILLQNGPLMIAAAVLILAGVQLLCLGLVGEILSRTYYESQKKPIYATRVIRTHEAQSALVLK